MNVAASSRVSYAASLPAARPGWTFVIAYYNEAGFLGATLASLTAQRHRPFTVILIDNGSTDGGAAIAADWAAAQDGIAVTLASETEPGQVHALAHGLRLVESEYVAIGDADTLYPADYLARADAAFAAGPADMVALFAHDAGANAHRAGERMARRLRDVLLIRWCRGQTYAGGYAHLFHAGALRAAGGYAGYLWPYVLKDHELVHRMAKQGRFGGDPDLWCQPSDRRADRAGVRWTLAERILYHATPFAAKDWFFYDFLGPRLAARGMKDTVLRQRNWEPAGQVVAPRA